MEPSNSLTEFSAAARQLSKELLFTHFRYIFGSFPPECPSPSAILWQQEKQLFFIYNYWVASAV